MIELRIKKLHPDAVIPQYQTEGAAGLDLTAVSHSYESGCIKYHTGLAVEIPVGFVGLLFPRSSIYKTCLSLANSVGVIDSDYRGEISIVFREDHRSSSPVYGFGDRVAQFVLVPIPQVSILEVQELTETQRGAGGWGSTGR